MRRITIIALSALTAITGIGLTAATATAEHHPHSADAPRVGVAASGLATAPLEIGEIQIGLLLRYLREVDRQHVATYVEAVHQAEVATAAEAAAEAATEAARAAPAPPGLTTVAPTAGGHSDAWWHGVAICEQGGRNDPFFGYFSFMDGSMGGQPWDVQVAAGNAVLARAGAESPAWAPSCVAAGYAASPSG